MSAREIVGLIAIVVIVPFAVSWVLVMIGFAIMALAAWLGDLVAWIEINYVGH
jgi:hypothetical protein